MKNHTFQKLYVPKFMQNIKTHKELHHTCTNPNICNIHTQPNENCKNCEYYKLREVKVVDDTKRRRAEWGRY